MLLAISIKTKIKNLLRSLKKGGKLYIFLRIKEIMEKNKFFPLIIYSKMPSSWGRMELLLFQLRKKAERE
jgi:hypothetical protein